MPGPWVKDWKLYEQLRKKGKSKTSAARLTNWITTKNEKKKKPAKPKPK